MWIDPAEDPPIERTYGGKIVLGMGVLIWSAILLTASYLTGPKGDVTFIASIFTASLASFGVERSAAGGNNKERKAPVARQAPRTPRKP